jgi:hypothetical protein
MGSARGSRVAARCILLLLLLLLRRSEGAREHRPHGDQFGGNSIVVRIAFDTDSCEQSTSHIVDDEDNGC